MYVVSLLPEPLSLGFEFRAHSHTLGAQAAVGS